MINNARDLQLSNLWCSRGCPERMTIRVKNTGETINLLNGLPVTDNSEKSALLERTYRKAKSELIAIQAVTDNRTCKKCGKQFYSKRLDAKYCGDRCRTLVKRQKASDKREQEAAAIMATIPNQDNKL